MVCIDCYLIYQFVVPFFLVLGVNTFSGVFDSAARKIRRDPEKNTFHTCAIPEQVFTPFFPLSISTVVNPRAGTRVLALT